jgi:long-subunit acyl-CoA synthetase (AMP-forming)
MTLAYAVHRLSGIVTPANAVYSATELEFQLKSAGAKALFTCIPLLETALQACKAVGIPNNRVYILDLPKELTGGKTVPFKTVDQLIEQGRKLKELEPLKWTKGQGGRQTAFLCYSSGTSGLPVWHLYPLCFCYTTLKQDLERSHDLSQECHHECLANGHL